MTMQQFGSDFLTFLERREEGLLSWGFHNVQYSETEMENALLHDASPELKKQWKDLQRQGVTFKVLLRELRLSNLLYRLPEDQTKYRTRMAEGVRLLANLRQMFRRQDWSVGPRLVSDIKIHLKDRVYPRRDIRVNAIWDSNLRGICPNNSRTFIKECFEALAWNTNLNNSFEFSGFQQRAFGHIFEEYNSGNYSGSVVCAGTGSGKTKAFYVPAFLRVAEELSKSQKQFTKIIAIYPRNVLLADQLREALSEADKLRPILLKYGHRPITFGALLGSSPWNRWFKSASSGPEPKWYWEKRGDGHVIPYLKSPMDDGKSDLIWKQVDRENERTSLYRLGESSPDIPDGVLSITREQLIQNQPDVLFLSLEMLNREMGNPQWRKTFGIQQGKKAPRLVLLDEVHTYEGVAGAQAAWVLRRWKYWVHSGSGVSPPHFVGLSATLKEAHEHLAKVCGINPDQVTEFSPKPGIGEDGEMETEGQEYNLAIKGDPSSGTALLSTSIQAGMLLTRLLTPRNYVSPTPPSPVEADKFFLKKAFGFTDNLDSLNRWFANMRNAERNRLARFRDVPQPLPSPSLFLRMRQEGQIWELPNNLGHNLNQSLDISRCSSQDPGANTNSDLILATSSLEVGFDDPQVGMIFHHKAPTSMSSFIQRKGRAGRSRGSRPWTVVILSDYGRDRWAFQAAERLFNPEIDRIHLPIANPYILRVQIALFLVDWLGHEVGTLYSPFSYLRKSTNWAPERQSQIKAQKYLEDFLSQGAEWKRFINSARQMYLHGHGNYYGKKGEQSAIIESELNDIFWEEPRPLLTEGIPALLRKLETDWKQSGLQSGSKEDAGSGRPMPQSIPKATFGELDLNEAKIELENFKIRIKDDEFLSMPQFLRECCPGRVSKRFSTLAYHGMPEPGYWHEFSQRLQPGKNKVSCGQLFSEHVSLGLINSTSIYRPLNAKNIHITPNIVESSSSEWQWNTTANKYNDKYSESLPLKGHRPWNQVFSTATACLHINGSWVELLRYAESCRFEIRRLKKDPIQGTLSLESNSGNPEAVGFQLKTDGLCFEIDNSHLQALSPVDPELLGQLRYEFFLDKLKNSPELQDDLNIFQAEWIAQISMSMLCATAIKNNLSLSEAQQKLPNRVEAASKVLDVIFQMRGIDSSGNDEEPRLKQNILELWQSGHIVSEIIRHEAVLWIDPLGSDFNKWLERRYLATLSQGLRVASATVSEQVNENDLMVDVISTKKEHQIFITEKSSGGLGQIESIVREIKSDPRFFLDAVDNALTECPREKWSTNLFAVTKCVHNDHKNGSGELIDAFQETRTAGNLESLEKAKQTLIYAMQKYGLNPCRSNVSAVSMKLLRPGSSKETDALTFLLNEYWQRHCKRIGLDIPIRTFAYLVVSYAPSRRRLDKLFKQSYNDSPTSSQLYSIIQQLLFEGCDDSCPDCLNNPNLFNDFGEPARNITLPWLSLGVTEVRVDDKSRWIQDARSTLEKEGRVCLVAALQFQQQLIEKGTALYFEELNVQIFKESVYISRLDIMGGAIEMTLNIRDFTNV